MVVMVGVAGAVGSAGTVGVAVGVVGDAVLVLVVVAAVLVVTGAVTGGVVVLGVVLLVVVVLVAGVVSVGVSPKDAGRGFGPPFMTSEKRWLSPQALGMGSAARRSTTTSAGSSEPLGRQKRLR